MLKGETKKIIQDKIFECGIRSWEYSLEWSEKIKSHYLDIAVNNERYELFLEQFEDFYFWLTVHYKDSNINIRRCLN